MNKTQEHGSVSGENEPERGLLCTIMSKNRHDGDIIPHIQGAIP